MGASHDAVKSLAPLVIIIGCTDGQKEAEKGAYPKAPHTELVLARFLQKRLFLALVFQVLVVSVRNGFVQPVLLRV